MNVSMDTQEGERDGWRDRDGSDRKGRLSAGNSRVRVSAFGLMHVCVCVQRYLVQ